jgi:SAM-dependent methyltransferase
MANRDDRPHCNPFPVDAGEWGVWALTRRSLCFHPPAGNRYTECIMDELSKEYVISFFNRNLQLHGDRAEAVRWSPQGQLLHYQSLLDIGDIERAKVLDFGCGKGDLYQFLRDKGISVDYTGYDINENLISCAQQKYPSSRFRVFDTDKDTVDEDFDYIFLCGVFNLRVSGLDEVIRTTLCKLFERCRKGLAFNALSDLNPTKDFELHYTSPEELFRFAVLNLSPHVALRHDRMLYDFTMFVYKSQVGEE